MSDPQIATAIRTTITHFANACAEMKKQASGLSDGEHRAGVLRGIDICAEAIKQLQGDVDEVAKQIGSYWKLTLPFVTSEDPDAVNVWLDPDTWSGDWQEWRNKLTIVVAAPTEQDARQYAAEHDCAIWLDTRYASCVPLSSDAPGVIISTGGQAENE